MTERVKHVVAHHQPRASGRRLRTGEVFPSQAPAGAHYGDVFALRCSAARRWTAEAWARAMFGDTPNVMERVIWQGILQLHLNPLRSPDLVAGWPIIERSDHRVTLQTESWHLTGQLMISTGPTSVELGTFVRYDRSVGAAVWVPLSVIHRRVAPGLLTDAYRSLSSPRCPTAGAAGARGPRAPELQRSRRSGRCSRCLRT